MKKEASSSVANRYLQILALLSSGGGDYDKGRKFSRAFIEERLAAQDLKVLPRMLQRDLFALWDTKWIRRDEEHRPALYWAAPHAKQVRMLTVVEAMSLVLLEDRLRPLMPRRLLCVLDDLFHQARNTLGNLQQHGHELRLVDRLYVAADSLDFCPAEVNDAILLTVQEALIDGVSLTLRYQARGSSTPREHRVRPAGLFLKGPTTYLVGRIEGKEVFTRFALHRVVAVERLEAVLSRTEPEPLPADFDFRRWCESGGADFADGHLIDLELIASAPLAQVLKETPLVAAMGEEELGDGRSRFRCRIPQSEQLLRWLLSQGPVVEVVAPLELRIQIADKLRQAADIYK